MSLLCSVTITITISATIVTNLIMCLWCSVWLCQGTLAALNIIIRSHIESPQQQCSIHKAD